MWRTGLASIVVGTLVAGILVGGPAGGPSPTAANVPGRPLHGDFDADGHADRATLGFTRGEACWVSVEPGDGSGGYGPAVLHPYHAPDNDEFPDYCPNLGIGIDLGGDGVAEMVVGWYEPPQVDYGLLVLKDYQPVATLPGVWESDAIHEADFNGDGLSDIYVYNYFSGFVTYLNTPEGDLVAGPMRSWGLHPVIKLADFNGNGAMDIVIGYADRSYGGGVAVVLDDGTVVDLFAEDPTRRHPWDVTVLDVNDDGRPDVRTEPSAGGAITTFIGDGDGGFVAAPVAVDDTITVRRYLPRILHLRANDHASTEATLTIVTQPRYGHLVKLRRLGLVYVRTARHHTPDTFVYRLTENDRTDTATVTIPVRR